MPALPHVWTDVEAAVVGELAGAAIEHATRPVAVQVHVAAPLADWYRMLPPHMVEQSSRVHDCPSAVPDISSTASTTSAL
jgi:hypothetical protein